VPYPIDVELDEDDDVIRPVVSAPPEETFPASGEHRIVGTESDPISPYPPPDDAADASSTADAYRLLGASAVANATLSAAGAPTPMGGLPKLNPHESDIPLYGEDTEAFVPRYEPAVGMSETREPTHAFAPTEAETEVLTVEQDEQAPFPAGDDNTTGTDSTGIDDVDPKDPWWRSLVALIAYGVVLMAVIGFAIYRAFFVPVPVTLPAEVLLEGPESNTLTPVEVVEPTDFVAGLPTATVAHALTDVVMWELGDVEFLPARAAEVVDLTYSDGAEEFVVRAYQHFHEDDAVKTYAALAGDAGDVEPVEAFGEEVGERALLDTDDGLEVVWRNGTVVFHLTGPEENIVEFFQFFGM
jgi:hypothetical protein